MIKLFSSPENGINWDWNVYVRSVGINISTTLLDRERFPLTFNREIDEDYEC